MELYEKNVNLSQLPFSDERLAALHLRSSAAASLCNLSNRLPITTRSTSDHSSLGAFKTCSSALSIYEAGCMRQYETASDPITLYTASYTI